MSGDVNIFPPLLWPFFFNLQCIFSTDFHFDIIWLVSYISVLTKLKINRIYMFGCVHILDNSWVDSLCTRICVRDLVAHWIHCYELQINRHIYARCILISKKKKMLKWMDYSPLLCRMLGLHFYFCTIGRHL